MSLWLRQACSTVASLEIDIGVLFSPEAAAPLSLVTTAQYYPGGEGLIDTEPYEHVYPATDLLNNVSGL